MRDAVLYTLAQAAFAGVPELATQPASAFDPLLRPFIRARVKTAIAKAREATKVDDGEHVLRLAFVQTSGSLPAFATADDPEAVKKAFESASKSFETPRKPTRLLTGIVALAIFALAGALVWWKLRPGASERFLGSPLGVALADPLTRLSSNSANSKKDEARKEILTDAVKKQIGAEAFDLLGLALDAPGEFVTSTDEFDDAAAVAAKRANDFNAALEKKDIPGFLVVEPSQSDVGARRAALISFQVHERASVKIDQANARVMWGYRLDESSHGWSRVHRPRGSSWALVNLSTISSVWTDLLVPIVKRQKASTMNEDTASEAAVALEKKLRSRLASELESCVGIDEATLERVTDMIEQRESRYVQVEKSFKLELEKKQVFQTPTKRLELTKMKDDPLVSEALGWDDRLRGEYDAVTRGIAPFAAWEEELFVYAALAPEDAASPSDKASKLRPETVGVVAATLAALSRERTCYAFDAAAYVFQALMRWKEWSKATPDVRILGAWLSELGLASDDAWMASDLDQAGLSTAVSEALDKKPEALREAARSAYTTVFGHAPRPYKREKN